MQLELIKNTNPQNVEAEGKHSKKDQIIKLFKSGKADVEEIALLTGARSSYVGSVLRSAGLLQNYFDLYTSTAHSMNVYSEHFRGKLGFRDDITARRSVRELANAYRQYEETQDRAGQHHTLVMAMTMFNRARWTGKTREAEVFRRWLINVLSASMEIEMPNQMPLEKAA